MKERILQLDYLKGIMIMLVVMFHVVVFDNTYPTLRTAVYIFHVPIFLLISGYLASVEKNPADYCKVLLRLLIPYIFFETLYILALFFMGNALHSTLVMNTLSLKDVIMRLVAYPLGVYWYLHALIICNVVYYLIFHYMKLSIASKFILMGVICYAITYIIKEVWWVPILAGSGFVWESIIYFLIGVFIRLVGVPFLKMVPPSPLSIIPLCILLSSTSNYFRGSLSGVMITLFVISFLFFIYNHLGQLILNFCCYLGRNSLAIFVFAPFIIPITKYAIPLFHFDTTVILFTCCATMVSVVGSLLFARLFDKAHLSRYLFGKEEIYVPYYQ